MPIQITFPCHLGSPSCLYCSHQLLYQGFTNLYSCKNCLHQFEMTVDFEISFDFITNLFHLCCIHLSNKEWEYTLFDNDIVYDNYVRNLKTNKEFKTPHNLILSPEDLNRIDSILLLL